MGSGIDLARDQAPVHATVLDEFKDQLLIVMAKRIRALGGDLDFPVSEVDDTGQDTLAFNIVDRVFHFQLGKKS